MVRTAPAGLRSPSRTSPAYLLVSRPRHRRDDWQSTISARAPTMTGTRRVRAGRRRTPASTHASDPRAPELHTGDCRPGAADALPGTRRAEAVVANRRRGCPASRRRRLPIRRARPRTSASSSGPARRTSSLSGTWTGPDHQCRSWASAAARVSLSLPRLARKSPTQRASASSPASFARAGGLEGELASAGCIRRACPAADAAKPLRPSAGLRRQLAEGRDAVVVRFEMEPSGSIRNGRRPARRAPTTSIPGMSPTYHASPASTPIASSASWKIRGSGFITPTAPESMTHSTSIPRPGPTCSSSRARRRSADHAVGIRDDAEPDTGCRQVVEPVPGSRALRDPERGIGELAVEMEVDLLAAIGRHAAELGVALQVRRSNRRPSHPRHPLDPKRTAAA